MSDPLVTAILVNWNGEEFLGDCLGSIAAQDVPVPVILVDNGSIDGSLAMVRREFPDVRIIENHPNNYAAANNRGVREAATEFVLQLNTDTVLPPDTVSRLLATLRPRQQAAGAAPRILYPDGRVYSTGVLEREDLYWIDRDEGKTSVPVSDEPEEVFGISGCCALYRRSVWLEVGGLDEAYHMYYEDVDFSLRVRNAGHLLLYCSDVAIQHLGHASISKTSHGKDALGERNRLLVLASHYKDRFADLCVRSPWFQTVPSDELRAFLPLLVERHGSDVPFDLVIAMRDDNDFPEVLAEREAWIAMLLREVKRLRIYRLPGKRLKPSERDFLRRHDSREPR